MRRRERDRGRPAAADLHLLPPGAGDAGARGADAARARRPHAPARSRARSWSPSRRWRSGSCAPSARSPRRTSPTGCRPTRSCPTACAACSQVVYLIFNEGYARDRGRSARARGAVRRGDPARRLLCRLMPDDAEVRGLLALMLLHDARRAARVDAQRPLRRARRPGPVALGPGAGSARGSRRSSARCACGGRARTSCRRRSRRSTSRPRTPRRPTGRRSPSSTARSRSSTPSPVVELNRAVAVGFADGPGRGPGAARAAARRSGARALPAAARGARRAAPPRRRRRRRRARLRAGDRADRQRGRARGARAASGRAALTTVQIAVRAATSW